MGRIGFQGRWNPTIRTLGKINYARLGIRAKNSGRASELSDTEFRLKVLETDILVQDSEPFSEVIESPDGTL
jgi:hypothetical protein